MTAWRDIRRRPIPNHQKPKTRKTPGELPKQETGKIETLPPAETAYSRIVKFIILNKNQNLNPNMIDDEERPEWDWLKKKTKS